jgi:hypothetical protein
MPLPQIQFANPRAVAWRTRRGLQRLGYLGDASSVGTGAVNMGAGASALVVQAPQAVTSLSQAQSILAQANADLITLGNAAAADATLQAKIGAQLNAANQQLLSLQNQLSSQLSWWHSLIAGTFPPYGIYQLSQVSTLLQQIAALQQSIAVMQSQVSPALINAQSLQQASGQADAFCAAADAALAAGDMETYNAYIQQCGQAQQTGLNISTQLNPPPEPPPAPFDLGNFLTTNWMWIALGVGAFVVIKKL